MFETLVVTKTEKPGARSLLSLPAALTFHAVAGLGFVFFSLYAPEALPAPPYTMVLPVMPAIPVTFVQRKQLPGAQTKPEVRASRPDTEWKAPGVVPSTVQPAPPAGPPTGPTGEDVPGGVPPELVRPGEGGPGPLAAVPVVPVWELLQPPRLLMQVPPEYPPALRVMGFSGKVVLEVMVDEDGSVTQVKVVSSPHPLLTQAAEAAVRQWKYSRPVSAAGGSVRVTQTVVVNFTLR